MRRIQPRVELDTILPSSNVAFALFQVISRQDVGAHFTATLNVVHTRMPGLGR